MASRKKNKTTKLFVLDTNVLLHDPTCLYRFEEHDVFIPIITLEELDTHKKGMSEVARNARRPAVFWMTSSVPGKPTSKP
nr:PIN domain-containing protein [Paludibacterium denitrificans]